MAGISLSESTHFAEFIDTHQTTSGTLQGVSISLSCPLTRLHTSFGKTVAVIWPRLPFKKMHYVILMVVVGFLLI